MAVKPTPKPNPLGISLSVGYSSKPLNKDGVRRYNAFMDYFVDDNGKKSLWAPR